jgi:hypothetical protein
VNETESFEAEDIPPGAAEEQVPAFRFPWPPAEGESVIDAFVTTWKEVTFHPARFFATMPAEASLGAPLLYYLIVGVLTAAIGLFWGVLLPGSPGTSPAISPIAMFLLSPVIQVLVLFLGGGLTHLMVLMLMPQHGPYNRTLRVYTFSNSPSLVLSLIPYAGVFIGMIWSLVLVVIGVREVHRSTTGRATAAILLPGCLIGLIGFVLALVVLAIGINVGAK